MSGVGDNLQVVQAVFGVFHHFELAHQLRQRGHLRKIYTSWPWARIKREGLPRELVGTYPYFHGTDYMLNRTRFYPQRVSVEMARWNALRFDEYTRRRIPACHAFIGISGAGLLTGQLVQARGGKFICDRGSTHQVAQERVLQEEYARWGVPPGRETPHIAMREEKIYALADAITVPSTVAKRSFVAMGVAEEKVRVIPYGVRLDKFHRTGDLASDRFEVLFAGGVNLRKGIPYLLRAFARLRHPRKRLTVVGGMADHLRPLLARLPVEDVVFTGSLPQTELMERMGRSHVMMLPSVEEGLALVQAQAMACECPVIATEATGAEDLFTDGVEGFIVPNRDVDALASRLQQMADDPDLRGRMAAAAKARVRALGGWETYGTRWDELLHELTGIARRADEPGASPETNGIGTNGF